METWHMATEQTTLVVIWR